MKPAKAAPHFESIVIYKRETGVGSAVRTSLAGTQCFNSMKLQPRRLHSQDRTLRTLVVLQHRHLADWKTAKVQPASIESHTLRVSLDIVMLVIY